jgi:cystathionine gamma-synthase
VAADAPLSPPIVATSTFVAGGERGYGRYGNPTWDAFESAMGTLEGGTAVSFASGMAAVSAAVAVLLDDESSGPVVVPEDGYHTSIELLHRCGRPLRSVRLADTAVVLDALPGAALLWVESPSNPLLSVADLPVILAAARRAGVATAVDATMATPLLLRPLDHGADVVVHAATKLLAGHSDLLSGVVGTARRDVAERLLAHRALHGSVPGAFETWLALRGLRTLGVRLERSQGSATVLAHRLAEHPAVSRVRYPGLPQHPSYEVARRTLAGPGTLVSVELRGGADAAHAVSTSTQLWVHATSFGGVESLLERRRRWASERPSVPDSLLRLSVGLEDVEDLWADLDAALTQA